MATTTPRPAIEALDVPVEQVVADAAALRLTALLAEQRHQYRDLDADSACRPDDDKFTCPACPPAGGSS